MGLNSAKIAPRTIAKGSKKAGRHQPLRESMTEAQASHLKMLADEVQEPKAFARDLSRREASRRIEALTERLRLGDLPPHTD